MAQKFTWEQFIKECRELLGGKDNDVVYEKIEFYKRNWENDLTVEQVFLQLKEGRQLNLIEKNDAPKLTDFLNFINS